MGDKIEVENVNVPGQVARVDAAKYAAMREAVLGTLPAEAPGMTAAEMKAALTPVVPQAMWPNGEKIGWWIKTVQLDLEAKGLVAREPAKPLRFRRIG